MSDPSTFTGVEMHAKWSDYVKDMAHLAHDAGLAWTGKVAAWLQVRLAVDGKVVADEDLFAPHLVQCPPGQHKFGVAFHRPHLGVLAFLNEISINVTVEPGKVTQLLYVQYAYGRDLVALGAWPWVDPAACPTAKITGWSGKEYSAQVLYRAQGMTMVQFPNGWRHWVDDSAILA
jgi:hypothetical protein